MIPTVLLLRMEACLNKIKNIYIKDITDSNETVTVRFALQVFTPKVKEACLEFNTTDVQT